MPLFRKIKNMFRGRSSRAPVIPSPSPSPVTSRSTSVSQSPTSARRSTSFGLTSFGLLGGSPSSRRPSAAESSNSLQPLPPPSYGIPGDSPWNSYPNPDYHYPVNNPVHYSDYTDYTSHQAAPDPSFLSLFDTLHVSSSSLHHQPFFFNNFPNHHGASSSSIHRRFSVDGGGSFYPTGPTGPSSYSRLSVDGASSYRGPLFLQSANFSRRSAGESDNPPSAGKWNSPKRRYIAKKSVSKYSNVDEKMPSGKAVPVMIKWKAEPTGKRGRRRVYNVVYYVDAFVKYEDFRHDLCNNMAEEFALLYNFCKQKKYQDAKVEGKISVPLSDYTTILEMHEAIGSKGYVIVKLYE